jgi:hypothetical protein
MLELRRFLVGGSLVLALDRVESDELLDEERLEMSSDRCDRRRSLAVFAVERRETRWRGDVRGAGLGVGVGGRWVFGRRGIWTDEHEEDAELFDPSGGAVAGVVA